MDQPADAVLLYLLTCVETDVLALLASHARGNCPMANELCLRLEAVCKMEVSACSMISLNIEIASKTKALRA